MGAGRTNTLNWITQRASNAVAARPRKQRDNWEVTAIFVAPYVRQTQADNAAVADWHSVLLASPESLLSMPPSSRAHHDISRQQVHESSRGLQSCLAVPAHDRTSPHCRSTSGSLLSMRGTDSSRNTPSMLPSRAFHQTKPNRRPKLVPRCGTQWVPALLTTLCR